jgi:16S rRNA (guanine527-N7)-methyltransferase
VAELSAQRVEQQIERIAAALAPTAAPSAHTRGGLRSFVELVAGWNQRVNLTAARDEQSLCEVLLADAFVLAQPLLVEPEAHVLDVGTGAGAPIIPLLLLREDIRATCVEPLHKRSALLRAASVRLGLHTRMRVREQRIEPAQPEVEGGPFTLALSRATFEPSEWLRVGRALAGTTLVMLADAQPPDAPVHTVSYALPSSGAPRTIARYLRE